MEKTEEPKVEKFTVLSIQPTININLEKLDLPALNYLIATVVDFIRNIGRISPKSFCECGSEKLIADRFCSSCQSEWEHEHD